MPVLFVGHGSPMNAIEDNPFTRGWKKIGETLPMPKAIFCISAHWVTEGTRVSILKNPKTIHDFYGFPKELYDMQYPAAGSPEFAEKVLALLEEKGHRDESWGLDHGTWSVLSVLYPKADVPVFQLSIDAHANPAEMIAIGEKLAPLREEGLLILGSGNVVHNLGRLEYGYEEGFDWAKDFDDSMESAILRGDTDFVKNYNLLGRTARLAVPTTEHFNPLLYVLGAAATGESIEVFNKGYMGGSVSMTSYCIGERSE